MHLQTTTLNGGQGPNVDTGLCFRGDNVATSAADATMAAGAPYDEDALRKAVRFARYASAIHGCIPGGCMHATATSPKAAKARVMDVVPLCASI